MVEVETAGSRVLTAAGFSERCLYAFADGSTSQRNNILTRLRTIAPQNAAPNVAT